MKVVINRQYGGFGLSVEAQEWLFDKKCPHMKLESFEAYHKGSKPFGGSYEKDAAFLGQPVRGQALILDNHKWGSDKARDCPLLVQVVEQMKDEANGEYATLEVIEIPDGIEWEIDEYDGWESIHEKHRSWP